MSKHSQSPVGSPRSLRRRGFITAALGVGGAAGAAIVLKPATQLTQGEGRERPPSRGYRETPHIQQYYRTAKV